MPSAEIHIRVHPTGVEASSGDYSIGLTHRGRN